MNEKKCINFSLTTTILLFLLVVVLVSGAFFYYVLEKRHEAETMELQKQVSQLQEDMKTDRITIQEKIKSLQEKSN